MNQNELSKLWMLKNQVNQINFETITNIVQHDNKLNSLDQLLSIDVNKLKQIKDEDVKKVLIYLISNISTVQNQKYD